MNHGGGGAGGAGWNATPPMSLLVPVFMSMMAFMSARKLALLTGLATGPHTKKPRVGRTRAPSQWGTLYSRMTPKEFRETFRIPRDLFDEIVTTLRPVLQTKYVGPA